MSVPIPLQEIFHYAHAAQPEYRAALLAAQPVFDRFDISVSARRAAHFMAQVMYESCALTALQENLHYRVARLAAVWPDRFWPKGPNNPALYATPEALANCVYAGRNGNTEPGDGYLFRGRGLLQLTGRANYHAVSVALRKEYADAPDLCADPDLAYDANWAMKVAAVIWQAKGCNRFADSNNLAKITLAISGSKQSVAERQVWFGYMQKVFGLAAPGAPYGA